MARPVFADYLQAYPFWMMDVAQITPLQAPVFNPLLGFTSISAPDLQVETYPIREGNWPFERHVVQRGSYSVFSARRAAAFYDSDFYNWVMAGIFGNTQMSVSGPSYRRPLLLIQFFSRNPIPNTDIKGNIAYGPFEFTVRIPARAWLLRGCVPTRWRSGNDFDAQDGSVSIAELDFQCELIEEISLGSSVGTAVSAAAGLANVALTTVVNALF